MSEIDASSKPVTGTSIATTSTTNRKSLTLLISIVVGVVVLAVSSYAGAILYFTWPINEFSIDKTGVFGDSFGLLTSLFSGLAFAGIIITILMQRDELALQREELSLTRHTLRGQTVELEIQNTTMQIQRFENTFFKMLEFFDSTRRDIADRTFSTAPIFGSEAINNFYDKFVEEYLHTNSYENGNHRSSFKDEARSIKGIKESYNEFYAEYGAELDRYYRTLYNLLKLIDTNIFILDKKIYTNLVRAQLSKYELALLFYNCLSYFAEEKMAPLVKKYQILKHVEALTIPAQNTHIWETFKSESRL